MTFETSVSGLLVDLFHLSKNIKSPFAEQIEIKKHLLYESIRNGQCPS